MAREFMEANYMEALLRAALLLGDLHRTAPIRAITISAFQIHDNARKLYPRCRIFVQDDSCSCSAATISSFPGDDYLILYPTRQSMPS